MIYVRIVSLKSKSDKEDLGCHHRSKTLITHILLRMWVRSRSQSARYPSAVLFNSLIVGLQLGALNCQGFGVSKNEYIYIYIYRTPARVTNACFLVERKDREWKKNFKIGLNPDLPTLISLG